MRPSGNTLRSGLALVAMTCALLAVPAAAQPAYPQGTDLRSPDAQDAPVTATGPTDLRSPDTKDFAEGRNVGSTIVETVPVQSPPADRGFDWPDAVVGFAAASGLALLLTAGVLLARRRGRREHPLAA